MRNFARLHLWVHLGSSPEARLSGRFNIRSAFGKTLDFWLANAEAA
jgi:hypothetical protein